ncbi:very short patch repair endonuclease [Prosthecochloris sp. ZM]|uniref:very short patch repair endonuclease n=1 Tax=Prosthecochloris sp. ZM TaxID=2283143 RepID=UPI000DF7F93C|nr:very short patch repair endonuclease [Prosthecochloris sp. ZM]
MVDRISKEKRSRNMSRIKSGDTKPELAVRKALHAHGLRFRLHRKDLPGTPDIVLPKHSTVIFVHGCFWHRHKGCRFAYTPKSRMEFWQAKFDSNIERDRRVAQKLSNAGWRVLIIWECETRDPNKISNIIQKYFIK